MKSSNESTTTYYLEMLDPIDIHPKPLPDDFTVLPVAPPDPDLNRRMYQNVGSQWEWLDRLKWSDEDWHQYVDRPELGTWIGRMDGQAAGYFELESQPDGNVQIMYFGLLPDFIGRGFGGPLLTAAIQLAWSMTDTRRVWVHTCTKDHQHALENYRRRGFRVYETEHVIE